MPDTFDPENEEFSFFKGAEKVVGSTAGASFDRQQASSTVRSHLTEALGAKNLAFLFGSGCSSYRKSGQELGIPTMGPMAAEFVGKIGVNDASQFISAAERSTLKTWLGLDVSSDQYSKNLERLMEALYGARFVYSQTNEPNLKAVLTVVESVIAKVTTHVLKSCTEGEFENGDDTVVQLYQRFYQRLSGRDRSLPRPWIFTTNYDLFNETAMDRLGIPYCNGFSGIIERRFNPATFRYTLAEQLDLTNRKWSAVENFVYLGKLHGSVNWIEDDKSLFPVREVSDSFLATGAKLLIYPTPAKQSASFASPYADLFREFQSQIVRDQSVLVTVGYSFGDEHVNNIIFQALTVPNFRLVAFVPDDAGGVVKQLRDLGDPRIWLVGSSSTLSFKPAHYFAEFVDTFLPKLSDSRIDNAVAKVLKELLHKEKSSSEESLNG